MAEALSVVERGWRGARQCSLILSAHQIRVLHLVKGRLCDDLLGLITPYPLIQLASAPRWRFPLHLWGALMAVTLRGQLRAVLVDNLKTLGRIGWWCRWCGITAVLVQESDNGYTLQVNGRTQALGEIVGLQAAGRSAAEAI